MCVYTCIKKPVLLCISEPAHHPSTRDDSFRVHFAQVFETMVQIVRLRDVARLLALHRRLHRLVVQLQNLQIFLLGFNLRSLHSLAQHVLAHRRDDLLAVLLFRRDPPRHLIHR